MSSVPEHQPPNPCSLLLAIVVTISLYPIIDQIINPQLENLFGPQNSNPKQQQQQRPTTHRDLLLLYIWVIAGSCGFFPIWFYFFGGGADGTILKT